MASVEKITETSEQIIQVLTFRLDKHRFAFKTSDLLVVSRVLKSTPVARSADFFQGMVSIRGIVTPLIDLRTLFFLPKNNNNINNRMLTIKGDGYYLALIVDQIDGFIHLEQKDLTSPPEILFDQFIDSVYQLDHELVLLLKSSKLVNKEEVLSIIKDREPKLIIPETQMEHSNTNH